MKRFWFLGVNCLGFLKLIVQFFSRFCFLSVGRVDVGSVKSRSNLSPEGWRRVGGVTYSGQVPLRPISFSTWASPTQASPCLGQACPQDEGVALFFLLPSEISLFLLFLWRSPRGILVVFFNSGSRKCTRLGSRAVVRSPGGFGAAGASHNNLRTPNAHI